MRKHGVVFGLLLVLSLTACGFRPLYGDHSSYSDEHSASLEDITIDQVVPISEPGVELKNGLIDRFYHHGYPQNAKYALKVSILITGRNIVIQKNDVTSRSQLVVSATYELLNRENRQTIDRGIIRAVGSFNVLDSQYTTLVTENTARRAAIEELADKLTMRLAVVMDSGKGALSEMPYAKKKNENQFLTNDQNPQQMVQPIN